MNNRIFAMVVVLALVSGMFIPFNVESDASTSGDYTITVPGTMAPDEPITATIGNGATHSWTLYVANTSEKYLDVTITVNNQSYIYFEDYPKEDMIGPKSSGSSSIMSGAVKIHVDSISDTRKEVPLTMTITVTDINDRTSVSSVDINFLIDVDSSYNTSASYNKFFGIFENRLPAPFNSPYFTMIVTIIGWFFIGLILTRIIVPPVIRAMSKGVDESEMRRLGGTVIKLISLLVLIIAINTSASIIGVGASLVILSDTVTQILATVILTYLVWKVYYYLMETRLKYRAKEEDSTIDVTLVPLFSMLGRILIWISGFAIVLAILGVNLSAILVSAGVVSLGITLGAQSVLSQFFSGILILTSRPFVKDDFLKINGEVLVVRKVGVMFTEFYNWDKDQIVTIPNNALTSYTISNLSKEDKSAKLYVYVSVAYGTDLKYAEKIMLDVAKKNPNVFKGVEGKEANVRLTNFLDSGLELRLGCFVIDFDNTISIASQLRNEIYDAFNENGIEIPFNKLDVYLKSCDGKKRLNDTISD